MIRLAVHGTLAIADRVPKPLLLYLGRWLGRAVYWLAPNLRRRAFERANRCLTPDQAKQVSRLCFERAGENLCLCLLLRRSNIAAAEFVNVRDDTKNTLCEAVATGRGVVFVSAHLGPFELLAARVSELGYSPAVVVRESYDPRLDGLVDQHRVTRGLEVIHRGEAGAAARMLRALRRGNLVGFLVDLPSRVRSLPCTFLGQVAMIPLGPQRLSVLTGANVVLGVLERRIGPSTGAPRFDLTLVTIPSPNRAESGTGGQNDATITHGAVNGVTSEVELTRHVCRLVEQIILKHPEDWPWMA